MGRRFFLQVEKMAELKNIRIAISGIYDYAQEELPSLQLQGPGSGAPDWVENKRIYKVYRPAAVLAAACNKFKMLPLTHHHPNTPVDGQNFRDLTVGYTGENPWIDYLDEKNEVGIRSTLMIYDEEALSAYNNGEIQLSPGYIARFEWKRGRTPNGQEYDIIMREITDVNHLALLPAGRGGDDAVVMDRAAEKVTVFDIVQRMKDGAPKGNNNASKEHVKEDDDDRGVHINPIKSIMNISDKDFYSPSCSYALPAIQTTEWKNKMGDVRELLLKKNIIERNTKRHEEFKGIDKEILTNALYSNDIIIYTKPEERPTYYTVAKSGDYYDLANIDVDKEKKRAEIVDWRRISYKHFLKMKSKDKLNVKAGDQSNVTDDNSVATRAAGLNPALLDVHNAILHYENSKINTIYNLVQNTKGENHKSIFEIARAGTIFDLVKK